MREAGAEAIQRCTSDNELRFKHHNAWVYDPELLSTSEYTDQGNGERKCGNSQPSSISRQRPGDFSAPSANSAGLTRAPLCSLAALPHEVSQLGAP
jgi:hypothetical protein